MKKIFAFPLMAALAFGITSCGSKDSAKSPASATLKVSGSNTMAQVGTAWAEAFTGAKVSVAGGGSGIGIGELTEGRIDICTSSRLMKPEERAKLKEKQGGKEAVEFVVGYDALAVFVNPANPIKEISMEQLKEIYWEGGSSTTWEQVAPGGLTGPIAVLGRENTSGTYEYFEEAVVGKDAAGKKQKFRGNISSQSSSQSIIDNLATVKSAIGYDGMAFKNDKVNWLPVSKKTGEPAVLPGVDDARSGKYPLARKLYLYTIGEPTGAIKEFIDFALSEAGQKLLAQTGYVSLK
jgi:phosphate transport system substrate-binding protein